MGDTRKSNDGPIHRYILTAAAAATVTLFLVSARQNNHTCLETTTTTRPPGGAGPMNDGNYDDAAEACVRWADSSRYPDPVNTDWLWLWGGLAVLLGVAWWMVEDQQGHRRYHRNRS